MKFNLEQSPEGKESRFELGQIMVTIGVEVVIQDNEVFKQNIQDALVKYMAGDWGITCKDDAEMNNEAISTETPDRILAVYETCMGNIWIITEWDRSVTTILFPSEY